MRTTVNRGERVRTSSSEKLNQEIDSGIIDNIERYAGSEQAIDARIRELDKEWDIERTLEVNAASIALTGVLLGAFVNKKWLILPAIVTSFLAQHAIQGWCPPLPLFRKMGVRTRPEIDREKYALKALRGDFKNVESSAHAWLAVNK
jgi:hypothetical protein